MNVVESFAGQVGARFWSVARNLPDVEFMVVSATGDGVERLPNITVVPVVPEGEHTVIDLSVLGDDPETWVAAIVSQIKEQADGSEVEVGGRARSAARTGDAGRDTRARGANRGKGR